MDPALIVSIVSLLVASAALFFSQLRPAEITLSAGPGIKIYYANGKGLSFYIPTTFINKAPKTGTVIRLSLTIFRNDDPETRYLFPWSSFSRFDSDKNSWVYKEMAHAFAVPGKSAVAETVWFSWPNDSSEQPLLREGAYTLVIHKYFDDNKPPVANEHQMNMTSRDIQALQAYREQERSTTIDTVLDRKLGDHKVLTKNEYDKLLSG